MQGSIRKKSHVRAEAKIIFSVIILLISLVQFSLASAFADTGETLLPIEGNKLSNPQLQYTSSASSIPGWKIYATDNISAGQGNSKSISTAISNGRRAINGISGFHITADNQGSNFSSYVGTKSAGNNAFLLLAQTHNNLITGQTYYFRAEVSGNATVSLLIYPGSQISGTGVLVDQTITATSQKQVVEIKFQPPQTSVTLSVRHRAKTNDATQLNISRLGFYLEKDYDLQREINALFADANQTRLSYISKTDFDAAIESIESKIASDPSLYTPEVISNVQSKIQKAKDLHEAMLSVENSLTEYHNDVLGKETMLEAVRDIIQARALKVTTNNFDDEQSLALIIEEGEAEIYAYYLGEAKATKKDELDAILGGLDESDYSAEKWDEIEQIIEDAKAAVDALTTLEEVDDFDVEQVEIAVSAVPDLEEEAAAALAAAKAAKKDELDAILGGLDEADYSEANWDEIRQIIEDAKAAVDALSTIEDVEDYGLDTTIEAVETVETLAEIAARELEEAKDAKLLALDGGLLAGYAESDYYPDEWTELTGIIEAAKAEVESAESLEQVNAVVIAAVKSDCDGVQTRAQKDLADAKAAKIAGLDALLSTYTQTDYSAANWDILKGYIDTAKDEVSALTTVEAVEDFDIEEVKSYCDDVQTKAQELASAKATKKDELDAILGGLDESDYSEANWDEIRQIIEDAKAAVDALTTLEEVDDFDVEQLEIAVSAVPDLEEEAAAALAAAKAAKIAGLDALLSTYTQTDYSAANWDILKGYIDTAKDEVSALTTVEAVEDFDIEEVKSYCDDVQTKAQELASAKATKKDELDAILGGLDEADYSEANWDEIRQIIEDAKAAVDVLTTLEEVDDFDVEQVEIAVSAVPDLEEEAAAALAAAKAAKKDELDAILGGLDEADYSEANWDEIRQIIEDAKAAVDALSTIKDVEDYGLDTTIEAVEAVETLAEIAARELEEAKDAKLLALDGGLLAGYAESDYYPDEWTELTGIIEAAKAEVESAESLEQVNAVVIAVVKSDCDGVQTRAQKDLADARDGALDTYEQLKDSGKYDEEGLTELQAIKDNIDSILNDNTKSDEEKIAGIEQLLESFKEIDIYVTYTENYEKDRPDDYDGNFTGALFGSVSNDSKFKNGTKIIVEEAELTESDQQNVKSAINDGRLTFVGIDDTQNLINSLKQQVVVTRLDIYLVDNNGNVITEFNGTYKVRLLLPEEFRAMQNIRIVYYDNNGAKVLRTVRDGNWIKFETTHFSDYYLVADPPQDTLNLWWVIILLLAVIAAEAVIIIVLKRRNDAKVRSSAAGLLAAIVIPNGAYIVIAVLGVIALALAAYAIYIFLKKPEKDRQEPDSGADEPSSEADKSTNTVIEAGIDDNRDQASDAEIVPTETNSLHEPEQY